MLYEQRIYHAMPGRMNDLLHRFEKVTIPIWQRIGIRPLGFWTTEVGPSNHDLMYLLLWDSMAEREERWAAFMADAEWQTRRTESEQQGALVSSYSNAFLRPTSFSKLS